MYVYIYIYSPAPGRIYVAAGGTYNLSLLVFMLNVYCDFTSLYLYVCMYIYSSCQLIVGVFARQMHSTTKFALTVLSKCVAAFSLCGCKDVYIYIYNVHHSIHSISWRAIRALGVSAATNPKLPQGIFGWWFQIAVSLAFVAGKTVSR